MKKIELLDPNKNYHIVRPAYLKDFYLSLNFYLLPKNVFIKKIILYINTKLLRKIKIIFNLILNISFSLKIPTKKNIVVFDDENFGRVLSNILTDDNYFVFDQNHLENGIEYHFKVIAYTTMGWSEYSGTLSGTLELLETGINNITSSNFSLSQNYPNPFNPITTLKYFIPKDSFVNVAVHDMNGKMIKSIVNENQKYGSKTVQWEATNNQGEPVSAGVYFYRIKAGDFRQTNKMILLK